MFNEIMNNFDSMELIKWDKALSLYDAHNVCQYFLKECNKAYESSITRRSNDPYWMNKDLKNQLKKKFIRVQI